MSTPQSPQKELTVPADNLPQVTFPHYFAAYIKKRTQESGTSRRSVLTRISEATKVPLGTLTSWCDHADTSDQPLLKAHIGQLSKIANFIGVSLDTLIYGSNTSRLNGISSAMMPSSILAEVQAIKRSSQDLTRSINRMSNEVAQKVVEFLSEGGSLGTMAGAEGYLSEGDSRTMEQYAYEMRICTYDLSDDIRPDHTQGPYFDVTLSQLEKGCKYTYIVSNDKSSQIENIFKQRLLENGVSQEVLLENLSIIHTNVLSCTGFSIHKLRVKALEQNHHELFTRISPYIMNGEEVGTIVGPSSARDVVSLMDDTHFSRATTIFASAAKIKKRLRGR